MVLDDGSLHSKERTHVFNIPNARVKMFQVTRPGATEPEAGNGVLRILMKLKII